MALPLHILLAEDSEDDAQLIGIVLRKEWPALVIERVETAPDMRKALKTQSWDCILSDESMPTFSALAALEILKQSGHDLPFIVISGTINMEDAVEIMRAGAHDFIRKDDIARLIPAVRRELGEAENRRKRREAEAAIIESEDHLRSVTDSSPDAIIATNNRGEIISWNHGARTIFGYDMNEVERKPLSVLIPDLFKDSHDKELVRKQENGKSSQIGKTVEMTGLRKDGSGFPLELSLGMWKGGKETFFSAIIRDITKRQEAERNKLQTQKMESLGSLVGGVVHDINNMLLPILNLMPMVAREFPEGSSERKRLDMAFHAAERVQDMVSRLLAFSREDESEPSEINIFETVQEAMGILRPTLPSTININEQLNSDTGTVYGDPKQIEAVLINLASNAADAMVGKTGKLSFSLSPVAVDQELANRIENLETGGYAKLSVADTGHGMDAETLKKIYEPFFTTKPKGEGTGLGLSMIFGTVSKYNGAISVYSKLGKGTSFDIYLPLAH